MGQHSSKSHNIKIDLDPLNIFSNEKAVKPDCPTCHLNRPSNLLEVRGALSEGTSVMENPSLTKSPIKKSAAITTVQDQKKAEGFADYEKKIAQLLRNPERKPDGTVDGAATKDKLIGIGKEMEKAGLYPHQDNDYLKLVVLPKVFGSPELRQDLMKGLDSKGLQDLKSTFNELINRYPDMKDDYLPKQMVREIDAKLAETKVGPPASAPARVPDSRPAPATAPENESPVQRAIRETKPVGSPDALEKDHAKPCAEVVCEPTHKRKHKFGRKIIEGTEELLGIRHRHRH